MKVLLCALVVAGTVTSWSSSWSNVHKLAIRYPASASDLANFYRAIQALTANPQINETAVAVV
jgi:hypothetical protein